VFLVGVAHLSIGAAVVKRARKPMIERTSFRCILIHVEEEWSGEFGSGLRTLHIWI